MIENYSATDARIPISLGHVEHRADDEKKRRKKKNGGGQRREGDCGERKRMIVQVRNEFVRCRKIGRRPT